MSEPDHLSTMTVGEIMSVYPGTIGVFLDFRLYCVGCPIARFHTITDAAALHGVSEPALRAAIERAITHFGSIAAPAQLHLR